MQLTLLLFDCELSETATSSMFTIVNHWKCLIFLPANTENIPKINQIKILIQSKLLSYNLQTFKYNTNMHIKIKTTIQIQLHLIFITRSSSTYLLIGNELHFFQALPRYKKTINKFMIAL